MADLGSPVIGFRTWAYDPEEGLGGNYGYYWLPGPNKAVCRSEVANATLLNPLWGGTSIGRGPGPRKHDPREGVPHPDCMCGLYGRHAPAERWLASGALLGAIFGWGEMEVTGDGFRCEYASVAMLAYNPHGGKGHLRQASEAADEFDVRLVEVPDLEPAALELGAVVPLELRPEPQKDSDKPKRLMPGGSTHLYMGVDPVGPMQTGFAIGGSYEPPRRKRWWSR